EEGREAVEHHELAGRDLARDRHARSRPHQDREEQSRQERLGRVEQGLRLRDAHAGLADLLRLRRVAAREDLLAADAAKDAQSRDGVRTERREAALGLALLGLALLQRLD